MIVKQHLIKTLSFDTFRDLQQQLDDYAFDGWDIVQLHGLDVDKSSGVVIAIFNRVPLFVVE